MEQNVLKTIGKIHSIETFGTVDGPGIRFVLFMQGCNLKCKYCHNRDSWDKNLGTDITVGEIISKIDRYKNYILPSGGGVTVTGGEPLLQPKFLIELFTKLKEKNIPTAIDTSGMVTITEEIKELISLTDLFLVDIKHIDSNKCKELVGCENIKELEFIEYLDSINRPIWIRYVLVPGITDKEEDIQKLKKFVSKINVIENIEILPYHSSGSYKWEQMGEKYEFNGIREASDDDVNKVKRILGI